MSKAVLEEIYNLAIEKVVWNIFNWDKEDEFRKLYVDLAELCEAQGFCLAEKLIKGQYGNDILQVISRDNWKRLFLVELVCEVIKRTNVLKSETIGETEAGLLLIKMIQFTYSQDVKAGILVCKTIQDFFKNDAIEEIHATLHIEGALLDLQNDNTVTASVWNHFYKIAAELEKKELLFDCLFKNESYREASQLFEISLNKCGNIQESEKLFQSFISKCIFKNEKDRKVFLPKIFEIYYCAVKMQSPSVDTLKKVLNIIIENKVSGNFDELIEEVLKEIPMNTPTRGDRSFILKIYQYLEYIEKIPVTGKLQLFIAGLLIENKKDIRISSLIDKLEQLTKNQKLNLAKLTAEEGTSYLKWVMPHICDGCEQGKDLMRIYNTFYFDRENAKNFTVQCAKLYLKKSEREKDYSLFCEYLNFEAAIGSRHTHKAVGEFLGRLNKRKLDILNEEVTDSFSIDNNTLPCWEEILNLALSANPLFTNISSLFKTKRNKF